MSIFSKPRTPRDVVLSALADTLRIKRIIKDKTLWMPTALIESAAEANLRSRENYDAQSGSPVGLDEVRKAIIRQNADVRRYLEDAGTVVTVRDEPTFWHKLFRLDPKSYSYGLVWDDEKDELFYR